MPDAPLTDRPIHFDSPILFDRAAIERYIPQREPFIFVDAITAFEAFKRVESRKRLTGNEPFFAGHFPGQPVMPGVLILENMAQTASFLVARSHDAPIGEESAAGGARPRMVFGMVTRARFLKPVIPPCELVTEVTAIKLFSRMGIVEAISYVGGQAVTKAKFQFGAMG